MIIKKQHNQNQCNQKNHNSDDEKIYFCDNYNIEFNMKGINYLIDDRGLKQAAVIDLEKIGTYWEDIEDIIIAYMRIHEKRIPIEKVKEKLNGKKTEKCIN